MEALCSCWCMINSVVMRLISCRCRSTEIKGIKSCRVGRKVNIFAVCPNMYSYTCHLRTRRHNTKKKQN